jgi:hypothetical protein
MYIKVIRKILQRNFSIVITRKTAMKDYTVDVMVPAGNGSVRDTFATQRVRIVVKAYDTSGAYQTAKAMFPGAKDIRIVDCRSL